MVERYWRLIVSFVLLSQEILHATTSHDTALDVCPWAHSEFGSAWEWWLDEASWKRGKHPLEFQGYCDFVENSHVLCSAQRQSRPAAVVLDNFRDTSLEKRLLAFGQVSRLVFSAHAFRPGSLSNSERLKELVHRMLPGVTAERFSVLQVGRHELVLSSRDGTSFLKSQGTHQTFGTMWFLTIALEESGTKRLAVFFDNHQAYLTQYSLHYGQMLREILKREEKRQDVLLRVLSYNIWNTMPHLGPMWTPKTRQYRYRQRMEGLANAISTADADIVALQEVRFDPTLGSSPSQWSDLRQLLKQKGVHLEFFVFQPAMALTSSQRFLGMEGVVVLSRFPIVDTRYQLLSREEGNPLDIHQRVCLFVRILVPDIGLVDVLTTHLSLDTTSRTTAIKDMVHFSDMERDRDPLMQPALQLLVGDFNAEPHGLELDLLNQGLRAAKEDQQGQEGFRDVWLELYAEAKPRSSDPRDIWNAFTFPCDQPQKRIDYIFFRGARGRQDLVMPLNVSLIGRESIAGNATIKATVGMEHPLSNIWPSDHRGVVATFLIRPSKGYTVPWHAPRNACTGFLSGRQYGVRSWSAHFPIGAFTAKESGGFREFGAADKSAERLVVNVRKELMRPGCECVVQVFENGDFSGRWQVFREGSYDLIERGWGQQVSAIQVQAKCTE